MKYILLFTFLLLNTYSVYACVGSNPTQLSALKDLYVATSGSNWKFPAGTIGNAWLSNNDYCSWQGVRCDGTCNNVISLVLSGVGMKGYLPASFSNLNGLNNLRIDNNNYLNGTLPENILTSFASLSTLAIDYTSFYGTLSGLNGGCTPTLQYINFGYTSLSYFDISNCKGLVTIIAGSMDTVIQNFPISNSEEDSFCLFPNLDYVSIDSLIRVSGYFNLSCFCNSPKLQYLSSQSNRLMGEVPNCLGKLTYLKEMSLYGNLFNMIHSDSSSYISLQVLDVSLNKLSVNFESLYFPALVKGIFNNNLIYGTPFLNVGQYLEILDLSSNSFSGDFPYPTNVPKYLQLVDMRRNPNMHSLTNYFTPSTDILTTDIQNNPVNPLFCSALISLVPPQRQFQVVIYVSSTYYVGTPYYSNNCISPN